MSTHVQLLTIGLSSCVSNLQLDLFYNASPGMCQHALFICQYIAKQLLIQHATVAELERYDDVKREICLKLKNDRTFERLEIDCAEDILQHIRMHLPGYKAYGHEALSDKEFSINFQDDYVVIRMSASTLLSFSMKNSGPDIITGNI